MHFSTHKKLISILIWICVFGVVLCVSPTAEAENPLARERPRFTLISSKELTPVHSVLRNSIKTLLPKAEEVYLDYKSRQAKKLINELNIRFIPSVIFNNYVALSESFFHMVKHNMITKKKGHYVIPDAMLKKAEVIWFKRRRIPKRLDVFAMNHCHSCKEAEVKLIDFLRKNKAQVDLQIRYITKASQLDEKLDSPRPSVRESLRQIAIQKYYPDKFWDYLILTKDKSADKSADMLGISLEEIDAKKDEALPILKQDVQLTRTLNIKRAPTFLWENIYLLPSLQALKRHQPFTALELEAPASK